MKRFIVSVLLATAFIGGARADITSDTDPRRLELLQYVASDHYSTILAFRSSRASGFWKESGVLYTTPRSPTLLPSFEKGDGDTIKRFNRRKQVIELVGRFLPALRRLEADGNADDRFVLNVLKARMAMTIGQLDVAAGLLEGAIADAETRGAEDTNLISALADLAAVEDARGNDERSLALFMRASVCGEHECPSDIIFAFDKDLDTATSSRTLRNLFGQQGAVKLYRAYAETKQAYKADRAAVTSADIAAWLGEFVTIDPLLQIAIEHLGKGEKGPISDARAQEELVTRLATLDGVEITDFIDTVNAALVSNIVAGRYQAAIAIAEATFGKFEVHTVDPKTWYRFQRFYGRALFRARDPRTREHYAWVVDTLIKGNWVTKGYEPLEEADKILLDLFDTPDLDTIRRLLEPMIGQQNVFRLHALNARLHSRQGDNAKAAEIMAFLREAPAMQEMKPERQLAYRAQHAAYLSLAGENDQAGALMADVPAVSFEIPTAADAELPAWSSFGDIRPSMELRDQGLYEGAAHIMAEHLPTVLALEARGNYSDAQALWQMAFTFARAGRQALAFDLMDRAARIASRISFETADKDGLELLERDRQRYLLFVDIAWGAATGQSPQNMSVLSRY